MMLANEAKKEYVVSEALKIIGRTRIRVRDSQKRWTGYYGTERQGSCCHHQWRPATICIVATSATGAPCLGYSYPSSHMKKDTQFLFWITNQLRYIVRAHAWPLLQETWKDPHLIFLGSVDGGHCWHLSRCILLLIKVGECQAECLITNANYHHP